MGATNRAGMRTEIRAEGNAEPGSEKRTHRKQRAQEFRKRHEAIREALKRGEAPLRIYLARESTRAIVIACLVSVALVCAVVFVLVAFGVHFSGPVPILVMCLVVCTLTLSIGGHLLVGRARTVSRPVELVAQAADRIAQGDFETRVDQRAADLDIAEFRDLVNHFNQMATALAGMDYMRRDFTSSVSHEFKTPIAAIAGMSELVADPNLPTEERTEYLSLIREQALRLSSLSESILDLTRFDNQTIVSRRERTDIDEQIRRDAIVLQERWGDAGIEIELDLSAASIETDPNMTHQIWVNLMDNAFKYGHAGGHIWITSRDIVADKASNEIVFHTPPGVEESVKEAVEEGVEVIVRDDGCGMSAEQASHAFERFYQADPSRSQQGCGLGLAIVSRVVELLGGAIVCDSSEGIGTTMTVRLPRELG